jgi:hypothetical protein
MKVELEVTLRCNAACPQCSRHCNLFDYGPGDMSLEQIERFAAQVAARGEPLDLVSVMGGEPTVHPELSEIMRLLLRKLVVTGHVRRLQIATNGILPVPDWIRLAGVTILTSPPEHKQHRCQLVAPCDRGQPVQPCDIPDRCGISLSSFGYFPCGAGGAIIRLFRLTELIRYQLPSSPAAFGDLSRLCRLCQRSAVEPLLLGDHDPAPSASFRRAIAAYHTSRPAYRTF